MDESTPSTRSSSQMSLQSQINKLGEQIDKSYERIERLVSRVEERVRSLESVEAGNHPLINKTLVDHAKTIEQHESILQAITIKIAALEHANKILTWLGGILGSALLIWIVGQVLALIN